MAAGGLTLGCELRLDLLALGALLGREGLQLLLLALDIGELLTQGGFGVRNLCTGHARGMVTGLGGQGGGGAPLLRGRGQRTKDAMRVGSGNASICYVSMHQGCTHC